jgi:predicted AlkP superfamily pyrophosphatase or phosphodiesterase
LRSRLLISVFIFALTAILFPAVRSPLVSKTPATANTQSTITTEVARPNLLLILVIDQFRYDYLVRFRPYFVRGGFNRLLEGGANFIDCKYDYATTATCPGHATLFTGAYPNIHGIIANDWFDSRRGRRVYCVEDPETQLVGGTVGPGFSPRKLMGDTVGDELHLATDFKSKVMSISIKDRASVIPGGHTADAAYWYDALTGHFVTSTYYMKSLPDWVAAYDSTPPAKAYCGQPWKALPETPGAGGKVLKEFTPNNGEACPDTRFMGWLSATPPMNQIELNFALQAIKGEHLGQGPTTDLLAISLSVNDYIGHSFGPYSPQVADVTLRTDRYLADFFQSLDQLLGLENVWIAFSADHGVAPTPAFSVEHHLSGPKAPPLAVEAAVEKAMSQAYGEDRWVQDVDEFSISLNALTLSKHNVNASQAEEIAAHAASSIPGIRAAFTRTQLIDGPLPQSPFARKASNSFNEKRSGDVFLVPDPYAATSPPAITSGHGSPWNYDAQVPLILWGKAFKPGTYAIPCQPIDLAPTLAAALRLTQPSGAQGSPLALALR